MIYRFDTGVGLMWEDNYGRRFLATVGQSAWSTNTGRLIPALVMADTDNLEWQFVIKR